MRGSVYESYAEINELVTGKNACTCCIADTFFNGFDKLFGNGATNGLVDELDAVTGFEGFDFDTPYVCATPRGAYRQLKDSRSLPRARG